MAIVAEDDVRVGPRRDRVAAETTQHDVRSVTRINLIVVSDAGIACGDEDRQQVGRIECRLSIVADDQVATRAAGDGVTSVAAKGRVVAGVEIDRVMIPVARSLSLDQDDIAGRQNATGPRRLVDAAVIAEDDVVTAVAVDGVAAHGERVARQRDGGISDRHGQQPRDDGRVKFVLADIEREIES